MAMRLSNGTGGGAMTKEEFEGYWGSKSGHGPEYQKEMGLIAIPCDCDFEGCQGWQMVGRERLDALPPEMRAELYPGLET